MVQMKRGGVSRESVPRRGSGVGRLLSEGKALGGGCMQEPILVYGRIVNKRSRPAPPFSIHAASSDADACIDFRSNAARRL